MMNLKLKSRPRKSFLGYYQVHRMTLKLTLNFYRLFEIVLIINFSTSTNNKLVVVCGSTTTSNENGYEITIVKRMEYCDTGLSCDEITTKDDDENQNGRTASLFQNIPE